MLFNDFQRVYYFPDGVIGYPQFRYFYLFQSVGDSPYYYLISLEQQGLFFLLLNPHIVLYEYDIALTAEEKDKIDLISPDDLELFVLVSIPDEIELISLNLRMPLFINRYNRWGGQKILQDHYPVKFYLFYEINDLKKKLV